MPVRYSPDESHNRKQPDGTGSQYDTSRMKLDAVIDSLKDAIVILDSDGNVVDLNAAATKLLSREGAQELMAGKPGRVFDLEWPDGSRLSPGQHPIRKALGGDMFSGLELVIREKDTGKACLWSCSGSPVRDSSGRVIMAVLTIRDITEERNTRQELLEAKARAELYLDLMSHDISNMNQIALGYLELAGEVIQVGEGDRELLRKPCNVLRRSSRLIEDVRTIRETRSGARLEMVDICKVLRDIRDEYGRSGRAQIDTGGVPVTGCWTMATENLYDIFYHLVCYSATHSGSLPPKISMCIRKVSIEGRQCYNIVIEDDSNGMPDWQKATIFDRLRREDSGLRGGATGLYLAGILAESYKGRVRVEDRVSGDCSSGCRFIVTLPSAGD